MHTTPTFTIETAIASSHRAHADQVATADQIATADPPPIEHPPRVMHRLHGMRQQVAAPIYDVLQDITITEQDRRDAGCTGPVIGAVGTRTQHPGGPLEHTIARAANPVVRAVEHTDSPQFLHHHCNTLSGVTDGR